MKKLFLIVSVAASLTTANAMAKTEGSSVGIGLIRSAADHQSSASDTVHYQDDNVSFALNYKYSAPLADHFYVAPGVSYNYIGTNTAAGANDVKINHRYTARVDVGYDIKEYLAAYLMAGFSAIDYRITNSAGRNNDFEYAPVFGLGFNAQLNKEWDLNFEYIYQQADLNAPGGGISDTRLETYMIGLAYNF
ncbi:MAG: outer membrane beta-barrel protein [Pseudomonadota bacterium]